MQTPHTAPLANLGMSQQYRLIERVLYPSIHTCHAYMELCIVVGLGLQPIRPFQRNLQYNYS